MYLKGKVASIGKSKAPKQGSVLWYRPELPESVYRNHLVVIATLASLDEVFHARTARAIIAERGLFTSPGAVLARLLKVPVIILEAARAILREHLWVQVEDHGGLLVSMRDQQKTKQGERFRPYAVGPWLLFRPRRHSVLRASLAREAVRNNGKILWGSKMPVDYREDGRGYWYKNFLTPEQLLDKTIKNSAWFKQKLSERRRAITAVQHYVKRAQQHLRRNRLTQAELATLLAAGRQAFIKIRPYTDLTNCLVDEQLRRFREFLQADGLPEQVAMAVSIATHSRYFETLVARGVVPPRRHHEFTFPLELLPPIFLPPVSLALRFTKLPPALGLMYQLTTSERRAECLKHLQLTALVSDISEEGDYTYRLLTNTFNYLLQEIAKALQRRRLIHRAPELLNMSIDELQRELNHSDNKH